VPEQVRAGGTIGGFDEAVGGGGLLKKEKVTSKEATRLNASR
jgi:hypothetical protein